MKNPKIFSIVSLFFTVFLFSCSEKDLLPEDVNIAPVQEEISANYGDETFVSSEQALEIAGKFFSGESGLETRALANAAVATVTDEKNGGNPAMYVINYPEGGWAIVSATRNYFPVLAHSDKGFFDLENVSQSGVSVWMAETKDAVRMSEKLADSVKVQINTQWLAYEEAQKKALSGPQTRGYNEMMNRIDYLSSQYGSQGWYDYMSLDEAYYYLGSSLWQNLVNEANSIGASTEYTIVAIKSVFHNYTSQTGPLLTTQWDQGVKGNFAFNAWYPPNGPGYYLGNRLVGCVAVALGQIMNYHQKPQSNFIPSNHPNASLFHPTPGWSHVFDWTNMSLTLHHYSSIPELLRAVSDAVYMNYNTSGANIDDARNALKNIYRYTTVTMANHSVASLTTVKSHINASPKGRPVYMRGKEAGSQYGHAWVCDGVRIEEDRDEYFVEFSVNNSYGSYSSYSPAYPGVVVNRYDYYHMNWGWGGIHDGWFVPNNISNPEGNYTQDRQNLYIIP